MFVNQQNQVGDSVALHLKSSAPQAAEKAASDRMIGFNDIDALGLQKVAKFQVRLVALARVSGAPKKRPSIDGYDVPL